MHVVENVESKGRGKEEITESPSTRQKHLSFRVPWLPFQELGRALSHSHNKKEAEHVENQPPFLDAPEN